MKAILPAQLRSEHETAVAKAWDALARYKFYMFGYWASRAVYVGQLARCAGLSLGNPFKELVIAARREAGGHAEAGPGGRDAAGTER